MTPDHLMVCKTAYASAGACVCVCFIALVKPRGCGFVPLEKQVRDQIYVCWPAAALNGRHACFLGFFPVRAGWSSGILTRCKVH